MWKRPNELWSGGVWFTFGTRIGMNLTTVASLIVVASRYMAWLTCATFSRGGRKCTTFITAECRSRAMGRICKPRWCGARARSLPSFYGGCCTKRLCIAFDSKNSNKPQNDSRSSNKQPPAVRTGMGAPLLIGFQSTPCILEASILRCRILCMRQ